MYVFTKMINCNNSFDILTKVLILKAVSEEASVAKDFKDAYQDHLEKLDLTVTLINVIDFKYTNLEALKEKLENPEYYSGLVFGSPRSVKAVEKAVNKLDIKWHTLPVFSVGETTARLAKSLLNLASEGSESGHGEALAPIIIKKNLKKPILMPIGNLSRDTIANLLNENGISTDAIPVYETIPHPSLESNLRKAITREKFDVIVYFSPSGVNATVPILRKLSVELDKIKWVSIGPTTEKMLVEHGLHVSATASKPTPESLATAVSAILT